jgi:hypothetical protein
MGPAARERGRAPFRRSPATRPFAPTHPFKVEKGRPGRWNDLERWTAPGSEDKAKRTFGETPRMMDYFSQRFGYDYPWPARAAVEEIEAFARESTP